MDVKGMQDRSFASDKAEAMAARHMLQSLVDGKAVDFEALGKIMAQARSVSDVDTGTRSSFSMVRVVDNVIDVFLGISGEKGWVQEPEQLKIAVRRALGR